MYDAHIHLDQYDLAQLPALIEKWQEYGLKGLIAVSTNLQSCYDTLNLSERFPNFVYPCLGWHPEQRLPSHSELTELVQLIRSEKHRIVGVGEIGLPHYFLAELDHPELEPYVELLTVLVREAVAERLPVALHTVYDKARVAYDLLQKENVTKAHFHWLKATEEVQQKISEAGYFVSVTPEVCYKERDTQLVNNVPLTQLLVETDGPWAFEGPFTGKETTPLFLRTSIKKLARLQTMSPREVNAQLNENLRTLYPIYR